jgi:hypothetical protein
MAGEERLIRLRSPDDLRGVPAARTARHASLGEGTSMRIARLLAATALGGLLFGGVAGPAAAAMPTLSALGQGAPEASSEAILHRLEALATTRTAAEIEAILASGAPAEILLETETNTSVAAIKTDPDLSAFAVSPVGPGCSDDVGS